MSNGIFDKLNKSLIRVPLEEKIMFTKHLSMMIHSGMSEIESVRLIRKQVESRGFGLILDDVIEGLDNGQFLSATLKPYERIFGALFISIINLGEVSGTLSDNLSFLSQELKENRKLKSKVKSALIYPIIILIATVSVVSALVLFVLPRILPIFDNLQAELPITTRILIASADFLKDYFFFIVIGIVVLMLIWAILLRVRVIKYALHRVLLVTPFAGNISKKFNMANITRTLGILLRSGVKIVEALISTSEISENLVYRKALLEAAESVKRGEAIYDSLERRPSIFPPTVTRMIEVGEKTGNLDENLDYLAEFYKNEVDERVANLSSVLEPALLLFMGGLVGFVAISIITPIYQLTQAF
jgi:type IV pilus assembly protein PilC